MACSVYPDRAGHTLQVTNLMDNCLCRSMLCRTHVCSLPLFIGTYSSFFLFFSGPDDKQYLPCSAVHKDGNGARYILQVVNLRRRTVNTGRCYINHISICWHIIHWYACVFVTDHGYKLLVSYIYIYIYIPTLLIGSKRNWLSRIHTDSLMAYPFRVNCCYFA